jgi:Ca2+-binding RTX toxin-like protein
MNRAIRLRRGLSSAAVAAIATGIAFSLAGPAAATAPRGTVQIDNRQLIVTGTNHADNIALRVAAADPTVLEVDFGNDGRADETVKLADFGQMLVNSRSGNDDVRIDFGTQTQPFTVVDTGDGNDVVSGGSGNELFRTGNGNDRVDGNRGTDTALLGNGDDAFTWDPGDGSDVVEGGRGTDKMLFNGSDGAEKFAATANGARLRFTRDLGNIVMDTDDVERVVLKALGGADSTTIGDLRGTDVRKVDVDLGSQAGGGDRAIDSVTVNGTAGRDFIRVSGSGGTVNVNGLKPDVRITHAEPTDQLTVDTKAGKDTVNSRNLAPGTIGLTIL